MINAACGPFRRTYTGVPRITLSAQMGYATAGTNLSTFDQPSLSRREPLVVGIACRMLQPLVAALLVIALTAGGLGAFGGKTFPFATIVTFQIISALLPAANYSPVYRALIIRNVPVDVRGSL
jgi:hypothetical protein